MAKIKVDYVEKDGRASLLFDTSSLQKNISSFLLCGKEISYFDQTQNSDVRMDEIYDLLTNPDVEYCYEEEILFAYMNNHSMDFGYQIYKDQSGKYPFLPFFALIYDDVLEKLVKCGLTEFVDHYADIKDLLHREKSSLKQIIGFPTKIAHRYNAMSYYSLKDFIPLVQKIYKKDPQLLNRDSYSHGLLDLWNYEYNKEMFVNGHRKYEILDQLNRMKKWRVYDYLNKIGDEYLIYFLYMENVSILIDFGADLKKYSLTPNSVNEAYEETQRQVNDISRRVWKGELEQAKRLFISAVQKEDYQKLSTEKTGDQEFEQSPYMILIPKDVDDLYLEGKNMHNCVSTYVMNVVSDISKILFLREKKNPEKSIGTIEIVGNKALMQAKSYCNRKLSKEKQEFIWKWCNYHGIKCDFCEDLAEEYRV